MTARSRQGDYPDRAVFRACGLDYRPKWKQVVIDIVALAFGILFACVVGVSIPLALFMLLFCEF